MRSTTARRVVAVAGCTALAAAMSVVGAGTAAAHPHGDHHGVTRTVEGSAIGSLPSADGELAAFISIFDPPRRDAFAGVEIFTGTPTSPVECFRGPRVDAELEGLDEAEAEGRTRLLCYGPDLPPEGLPAYVEVDVEWEGFGPVGHQRITRNGCTVKTVIRQAEVEGHVQVRIPALDVEVTLTDGFGDLRRTTSTCPKNRS